MIQQFLQLGGVRTVEEFYKKFPTEAHFDAHVYKMKYGGQMSHGGGIYAYDTGGPILPGTLSKVISQYRDYEKQPKVGTDGMTDFIRRPTDESIPFTSEVKVENNAKVSSEKTKETPYGGVSIVDLLNSKGKRANYASRKKLAESLGIQGYRGTPNQNKALIKSINDILLLSTLNIA